MTVPRYHDTVVVVLAAGRGTRLGGPKLFARLEDCSFGELIRSSVNELGLPVVWVVREHGHASNLGGTEVLNPLPDGDMYSSVTAGFRSIWARWYMIWPVDVPLVRPDTVRSVLEAADGVLAVQPVHDGRRGHPYLVHRRLLSLASVQGARNMRDVFSLGYPIRFVDVPEPGVALNVNTPDDLERAQQLFRT